MGDATAASEIASYVHFGANRFRSNLPLSLQFLQMEELAQEDR
jgi:hypothetical protein